MPYYYHDSFPVLNRLLRAVAPEATTATLRLGLADLVGLQFHPEKDNAGLVLDFADQAHVWEIRAVRKLVEQNHLAGYEVDVVVLADPFPDEMTAAGTSRALALTTSADRAAQEQSPLGLAQAGVFGIRADGGYAQITRIYWDRVLDKERTEKDPRRNPRQRPIGRTELLVDYRYEKKVTAGHKLTQERTSTLAEYQQTYLHIEGTFEAHLKLGQHLSAGGELPADLREAIDRQQAQDNTQASTALVTSSNPEFLRSVAQASQRHANTAGVLRATLERNITEMRNRLAVQMQGLHGAMEKFKLQMEKVQRLIVTLELYLGVHESLIQIAQGAKAADDEPICLRQLVLYADEEFGDPKNGGLTFKELPAFDAWLVESGAYRLLAPEARCVVAIKPRRKARVVDGDVMPGLVDGAGKALDSYTYILIRNGDNLYRIQTPNVEVGPTLFPLRKDFQGLLDRMGEIQELEAEVLAGRASESWLERRRGEIEKEVHGYQKSVWLLQGLLFRTDVLHPLPVGLNLMKPETYGELVKFIYDAEYTLPSGRLSFRDWQKDLNSRIQRGTRVLAAIYRTRKGERTDPADYKSRFTLSGLSHKGSTPPLPPLGVYSVEHYDEPHTQGVYDEVPWAELSEEQRKGWRVHQGSYDHDLKDWVVSIPEPATMRVHRQDGRGRYVYEETITKRLVIRYNPGDTVTTSGWGQEWSEHKRKNAVGFKIAPERDEWLFNYDELTLDDINFYLSDRVERQNYVETMPFLYELRKKLEKELAWEREFTRLLAGRLATELADVLPAGADLAALTEEAIRWYKLDKVKIKRSLTGQDAQALRMVEQRVRYFLRERHRLRDQVEAGVDYRKKTLIWHHKQTGRSFVGTSLLKSEFVEECLSVATEALPAEYCELSTQKAGRVTRTRIEREVQDTTLPVAVALAQGQPGQVQELVTRPQAATV